ncbi:MAG TPA: UDP-glucose 4-epimerase GalE [Ramlibacter sp.]|nr:UDP-glucose 4-epimerase GalE [Ramlibacter sp.]HSV55382.1 UDP-glucose 4-epimerase GalE [Burkholderiaceae bacterium]
MKHVLVTGGAGYIGSHACKALKIAGYLPISFDNLSRGHAWAVRWGPLIRGDILDRAALDEAFRQYAPIAVMHFAAFAYVGESELDPGMYYRNNVLGSLTLLQAMRDHGVDKIVFSSTCAVYGHPIEIPITEAHRQAPINPYGATKSMVERMLQDFGAAHRLRSVSLRYFNAAGADPDRETGESHEPEPHLIPLVLDAAAGLRPDLTILGDDHPTPDGTCIRDFVHVTDLADAHVLALRALEAGAPSDAYNLGNGEGFSVRQVVEVAQSVTGRPVVARVGAKRAGDPAHLVGDATRARRELGWAPRHPQLRDIIETAWAWHQSRPDASVAAP